MTRLTRPSISFQGSGCVIVYHIGVARYLQENFDLSNVTFLAASGGSIVAAMLALGLEMEVAFSENCRLAIFSRQLPFGPFGRILDDVAGAFDALLINWTDEDVKAKLANGKLVLSLTHAISGCPRLMINYNKKETLINSVWCSMNLPIFMCKFRRVENEWYVDGGITNNHPVANHNTIRVSPTDTTAQIVPDEVPGLLEFLVPGDQQYMENMHDRGYETAKKYHHIFVNRGFRELKENRIK